MKLSEVVSLVVGVAGVIATIAGLMRARRRKSLIAASVALIAVAALAAFVLWLAGRPTPSSPSVGHAVPTDISGPGARGHPGPEAVDAVRFRNDVLLSTHLDLDQDPPRDVGPSGRDLSIGTGRARGIVTAAASGVARWAGPAVPTRAECADVLARFDLHGDYPFGSVARGLSFCLSTTGGRVAFVRLEDISDDGYLLWVVVWKLDQ